MHTAQCNIVRLQTASILVKYLQLILKGVAAAISIMSWDALITLVKIAHNNNVQRNQMGSVT